MLLCKDCRHVDDKARKCLHAAAMSVTDVYDGAEKLLRPSVGIARSLGACGPEGRLFEIRDVGFV